MTQYGKDAKRELDANCPEWGNIPDGESVTSNHATCPAGEDKRGRFGVKNVGGAYLWHCFNCGDSGYFRPKENYRSLIEESATVVKKRETVAIDFTKLSQDYDEFTTEEKLWLASYGFLKKDCVDYQIRKHPSGVALPVYYGAHFVGYQVRSFDGSGRKYTTHVSNADPVFFAYPASGSNTLVIVEDLLSAYKVHNAGYMAISLMGTSLKVSQDTLPDADRVIIWLDDDVAGHKAAHSLVINLSLKYPQCRMLVNAQPKECSIEEIKEFIDA